jgi:Holliday junction resolvase
MDKRDANEKEIVRFFRRQCGCVVIRQDRHAGFDLLVIDRDTCYVVEIKRHEQLSLTVNEQILQAEIGKMYHIVTSVEEAAKLIGR